MNAREVADELGVSERTVRRWIAAGLLRAERKGGAFVVDLDEALLLQGRSASRGRPAIRAPHLRVRLERLEQAVAALQDDMATLLARGARS